MKNTECMELIKLLRGALLDARGIILNDLGTEIESIENALEKSDILPTKED